MERYVALLRGINVGGHTRVPMAELREIATSLGWQDVSTHLNTGNLFFATDHDDDEIALASQLAEVISARLHVAPPILIRTRPELDAAATCCRESFPGAPERNLVIAFLSTHPEGEIDDLLRDETEEHHGFERGVALFYPSGQGKSRLDAARLERLLGVTATVRGLLTVEALVKRFP